MSRLSDAIESIERDLRSYSTGHENDLLNRRFILRKALRVWGDERYEEGHGDGMRDVLDTRREAKRLADEAAKAGEGKDGA